VVQLVALAAVRVEHDQDVLRAPYAQLARGLAGRRVQRLVPDQVGIVGILDVHHHDAAVGHALVPPIGPAADVRIVAVDRDRGVHAAVHERLVPDLFDLGGRPLRFVLTHRRRGQDERHRRDRHEHYRPG
jgi:hypothetical protein